MTTNLDVLVEKWVPSATMVGKTQAHSALKQCALEWAKEVQKRVDALESSCQREYDNAQEFKHACELSMADRDQWKAQAAAWSDYAVHQEHCATCADAVSDCFEGTQLRDRALELSKLKEAKG